MAVAVAVAVAVSGGGAVAVAVAGLTKRFFNHIQKDFLINVWGYERNDDDDDNDGDDDDDMEPYKITCRKTQVQLAAGTVSVRGDRNLRYRRVSDMRRVQKLNPPLDIWKPQHIETGFSDRLVHRNPVFRPIST